MPYIDKVKQRIGLTDDKQDVMLQGIIDNVEAELIARLPINMSLVPHDIQFIIIEIAIKRFNKTGAEGMTSESIDGRSNSYEQDDFKQYEGIIKSYFPENKKGWVKFY